VTGTGLPMMVTRATLGSTEFTGIPSSGEQRPSADETALVSHDSGKPPMRRRSLCRSRTAFPFRETSQWQSVKKPNMHRTKDEGLLMTLPMVVKFFCCLKSQNVIKKIYSMGW
jgi:hypothetical protein